MDIINELSKRIEEAALVHLPDDAELFIQLLTLQRELEGNLLEFQKLYEYLTKSK